LNQWCICGDWGGATGCQFTGNGDQL